MKAERRHELQTNSLAQWLWWRAPEIWQKHGSKILLGVVLVALGVVLFIRLRSKPEEEARRANLELAQAARVLTELRQGARLPGEAVEAEGYIQNARNASDAPNVQAQSSLLLGDYYWELASYPVPAEAATRPALKPSQSVEQLLERAANAYQQALADKPESADLMARAHMGLGAVAETRAYRADRASGYKTTSSHWATARQHYEAVVNSPAVPAALKEFAREKLGNLDRLQQPVWLVPATGPSTAPSTGPTTGPSTGPATAPVRGQAGIINATRPATRAATTPAAPQGNR